MIRFREILIDKNADDYPLTGRMLTELRARTIRRIDHAEALARLSGTHQAAAKLPEAKKTLLLTTNSGSFFKSMGTDPGVTDCQRAGSHRMELFQGCPVDCRYCFCQRYLSGHHVIVFTNLEDAATEALPTGGRLVTGDIADSLALGSAAVIAHQYAASILSGANFELRSKFCLPENWNRLDPTRFRLDWTLSPGVSRLLNEPGTPSSRARIASASLAAAEGYEIGIRLDPLQPERIDPGQYRDLIRDLRRALPDGQPRAFIIGSYKMSSDLLKSIRIRFPQNPLPGYEWSRCTDGKLRPFRTSRIWSYRQIMRIIGAYFPGIPIHLSMEPAFVLNLLSG